MNNGHVSADDRGGFDKIIHKLLNLEALHHNAVSHINDKRRKEGRNEPSNRERKGMLEVVTLRNI
jgi:hypothetical protein